MSNPYKDIASYSFEDSSKFKGREEDIKKFFSILSSEICSVLYAESGIGKTSFINAGIEPIMIQQGYFPIHIIIPEYVFKKSDTAFSVEKWLVEYIKSYNGNEEKSKIIDKDLLWKKIPIEIEDNIVKDRDKVKETLHKFRGNLWWLLHTYNLQVGERVFKPYIVFDQFEEIFVKTAQNKTSGLLKEFFSLMEQVTSNSIPDIIRSGLDELADVGAYFRINSEADYKITFSLRKEFLSDFDYWTNEEYSISELYRNRMMLRPLTKKQAEIVITKQPIEDEAIDGNKYDETLKGISDDIINKIDDKGKDVIEPVLLSIICSRLYDKASTLHKKTLDKSDLQLIDISTEINDFYEGLVQKLIKEKIFKGEIDVERFENLFVSETDGHRLRKSMRDDKDLQTFVKSHIKKKHNNPNSSKKDVSILDSLENLHLIRSSNVGDDVYIELIHDRLAEIIHQKQLAKIKNRQEWKWRLLVTLIICGVFLYTLSYLRGNPEGKGGWGTFTEIENRTVLSNDTSTNKEYIAEEILLTGDKSSYDFWSWEYLRSIKTISDYKDLYIYVRNCQELKDISICNKIDNLKISLCDVSHVKLYIGPDVDSLEISVDEKCKPIFAIDNHHFKLVNVKKGDQDDVFLIWDAKREQVIYAPYFLDTLKTNTFDFPEELQYCDSIICKNKIYYNKRKDKYNPDILNGDSITFYHNIPNYYSYDNAEKIVSICLKDSVSRIGNYAFSGNEFKNLKHISFSENLDTIESAAFSECKRLEYIHMPPSLRYVGTEAFKNCKGLRKVVFSGRGPLYLAEHAFAGCSNLEYVEFPDSVIFDEDVSPSVFYHCPIKKVVIKNPQTSNLGMRDSVVYEKNSGIPLVVMTKYSTYQNKDYYSKYGMIYRNKNKGERWIVYTCQEADFESLARSSNQYTLSGNWVVDWGNYHFYAIKASKELRIPVATPTIKKVGTFSFGSNTDSLERIYIPYPHPYIKGKGFFSISLPDSVRSKVSLIVPFGCKKYYVNSKYYKGYKSIDEDSWWKRYTNNIVFYTNTIVYYFKHTYLGAISLIFVLVIMCLIYITIRNHQIRLGNDYSKWIVVIHCIIITSVGILVYIILYWFFMLVILEDTNRILNLSIKLRSSVNILLANVIAIPFTILVLLILFSRQFLVKRVNEFLINLRTRNWKRIIINVSFIIAILFIFKAYYNTCDLERMLLYGKYRRATNLMYDKLVSKKPITIEDSILFYDVLRETLPYLRHKRSLDSIHTIMPFYQDGLLLISKKDSVILLDFKKNDQSEYILPSCNAYYVNKDYIFGYSNDEYSYYCNRATKEIDSIKGKELHFADNGKYIVSNVDSSFYVYKVQQKAKLIKAYKYSNNRTPIVVSSKNSHFMAVQPDQDCPVRIYDLNINEEIYTGIIGGDISRIFDNMLISHDHHNKSYVYTLSESLPFKNVLKGAFPQSIEDSEINLVTIGAGSEKVYLYSFQESGYRTDSIIMRNPYLFIRRIVTSGIDLDWDVVSFMKKVFNENTGFVSLYKDLLSVYDYSANNLIVFDMKSKSSHIVEDSQHIYTNWNTFVIDDWIFGTNLSKVYVSNYMSTNELINKNKYLSERQKRELKRKLSINEK